MPPPQDAGIIHMKLWRTEAREDVPESTGGQARLDLPRRRLSRVRASLRRRLPTIFLDLGACCSMLGRVLQLSLEHREVLLRTHRRMRAEGLIRERDDARAQVIAREELARYRSEFRDDTMKFEVTAFEEIDPWKDFSVY